MDELFKKELRTLCMEVDLSLPPELINSPVGMIQHLRGETVYRYYLAKNKISEEELCREVELYKKEYNENKKDAIYKN